MTAKLYLANRTDLDQLGRNPSCPVATVRVMQLSEWTPESAKYWIVIGADPGDQACTYSDSAELS